MGKINYKKVYDKWVNNIQYKPHLEKLKKMSDSDIYESFYKYIEFGVAGSREKMHLGINRMNIYTVRKMVQGYLVFLKNKYRKELSKQSIVIIHDNRNNSEQFAIEAANILSSAKITIFLARYNDDVPTPFGASMIQYKKSIGAVIITASHNGKEYNGLKIYNEIGAQAMPVDTNPISKYFQEADTDFAPPTKLSSDNIYIKYMEKEEYKYYRYIAKSILIDQDSKKTIKIAFSPLYGTSRYSIPLTLKELKYDFYKVESECVSDPNYNNLKILNPENIDTFKNSIKLAIAKKCDIVFQADPDADRIGMLSFNKNTKKFEMISTNKLAILLLMFYIEKNIDVENKYIYKNFVSNTLIDKIANNYKIKIIDTPIGPKWMANGIYNDGNTRNYVFAFEESCGFIISDLVRDKDSCQGIVALTEAMNYFKNKGLSYNDFYDKYVAKKYGYLLDDRIYLTLEGSKGIEKMESIMTYLRTKIKTHFLGDPIVKITDYLYYDVKQYQTNLLKIYLNNEDNWIAIRPSGTEPKLKFYINVVSQSLEEGNKIFIKYKNNISDFVLSITENK